MKGAVDGSNDSEVEHLADEYDEATSARLPEGHSAAFLRGIWGLVGGKAEPQGSTNCHADPAVMGAGRGDASNVGRARRNTPMSGCTGGTRPSRGLCEISGPESFPNY